MEASSFQTILAVAAVVIGTAATAVVLWRTGRRGRGGCDKCPYGDGPEECRRPPDDDAGGNSE